MKKQYNKPQIKAVVIMPLRTFLTSASLIDTQGLGTTYIDSRRTNSFEDEEEEEEDSMWK